METQNAEHNAPRAQLCVLRITLNGISPAIWRRLVCPMDVPLELLGVAIQEAFEWNGAHGSGFKVTGTDSSSPASEDATLQSLSLKVGSQFQYQYDFGDGAKLTVVVEEIRNPVPLEPEFGCRGGERSAPPESCGGIAEWQEILAAHKNPAHPRRKEFDKVYDFASFDPEQFDVAEVNERIQIELLLDDKSRDLIYQLSDEEAAEEAGVEPAADVDKVDIGDNDDRINILLSVALTNQLMADEPKEVLGTIAKLIEAGFSEDEALGEVYAVFSDEFFESQIGDREFNMGVYLKNLKELARQAAGQGVN